MLFFSRNDFKISVVLSNPTDNEGNPVESIVSGGGLAHDYKFHSFHFHWVCSFVTVFFLIDRHFLIWNYVNRKFVELIPRRLFDLFISA